MFKKRAWATLSICLLTISAVCFVNGNRNLLQNSNGTLANANSVSANYEFDVCMHIGSFTNTTVNDLKNLGAQWVRIDWIPNNETMGNFMKAMHDNNINVLAIIDANTVENKRFTMAQWIANVTSILKSPSANYVDAWEIWNEPNSPIFPQAWFSTHDYYYMLSNASAIIRSFTNAPIVAAGLSPDGNWTVNDLYASYNDIGNYIDYQGVHVYGDVSANVANIAATEQITKKPIWVTEYGYPSNGGSDYNEANQEAWLQKNFAPLKAHADKVFWYELYDETTHGSAKENSFGLLMTNESRKLSFKTLSAVSYLTAHFNQTIGLVYESEVNGTQVINGSTYKHDEIYYIYSDNLLAEWALKPYAPQISDRINKTIQSYNLPPSNFFEVLFGKNISTISYDKNTTIINKTQSSLLLAEFHDSSMPPLLEQYGNTLIYKSLNNYLNGERKAADGYFYEAYNMSDGKGIFDNATILDDHYDNYKLALILYASKVLNLSIENYNQIETKLWSMQQANGGITSWADLNGNPIGSANTETTSMALLPYNNELICAMTLATTASTTTPSPTPEVSTFLVQALEIGLIIALVSVALLFLVLKSARKKTITGL